MAQNVGSIYSDVILGLDSYKKGLKDYVKMSEQAANKAESTFDKDYTKSLATSINKLKNNTIGGLEDSLSKLQARLAKTEIGSVHFKKVSNAIEETQRRLDKANGSQNKFNKGVAALGTIVSAGAFLGLAKGASDTAAQFEKYQAVLTNTLGSQEAATESMTMIKEIAASTPFSVNELTGSFIKLANRGIIPTKQEIILLGDIAASQGKSFDQLTEAMLDAMTGEFERMKEFGIKGSKAGDKVSLSFKNVTKTVDNTEEAIKKAVLQFGKMDGVAGGMEAISKTTAGAMSNLGDATDTFKNSLGMMINDGLRPAAIFMSGLLSKVSKFIDESDESTKSMIKFAMALTGIATAVGVVNKTLLVLGVTSRSVWTAMLGPIGMVTAAIAAAAAALSYLHGISKDMEAERQASLELGITGDILSKKVDLYKLEGALAVVRKKEFDEMNQNASAVRKYKNELSALGLSKKRLDDLFVESARNKNFISIDKDRLEALYTSINAATKKLEKRKTPPKINLSVKPKKIKQKDLMDEKNLAQAFIEEHPLTLPFAMEEGQAPLRVISARVQEFVKKLSKETKVNLNLDGKVDIKSYEDFERILTEISRKYGITMESAKKLFDLKPRNAAEIDAWNQALDTMAVDSTNALRQQQYEEKAILESKLQNIRDYNKKVGAERGVFDELTGGRSDMQQSIDKASDAMKRFGVVTEGANSKLMAIFTNKAAGTSFINMIQSFATVGKKVFDGLMDLASKFAENIQAKANLMKQRMENITNQLSAFNHYNEKAIEEQNEAQISAYDQQIEEYNNKITELKDADTSFYDDKIKIAEEKLDELDALEEEYDLKRKIRMSEFAKTAEEENRKQLGFALERLRLEYEAQIQKQQNEQTDEQTRLFNIENLRAEFAARQRQTKEEYDELLKQDIEENEEEEDKKKEEELGGIEQQRAEQKEIISQAEEEKTKFLSDKEKERLAKEQSYANQIKTLENQKAQFVEDAEKRKEERQKQTKIAEWLMGLRVFQVQKRAEMMQAQIAMAQGVMSSVMAGINIISSMSAIPIIGPLIGIPMGMAMMATLTGLSLSTGKMNVDAISAKQYPPLLLADGMVGIGTGSDRQDTIPAMLSNGESVISSDMTRRYRNELEQINAGTFNNQSMQTSNNYYVIMDGKEKEISERQFDRLYSQVNSGFGRRI